jgi:dephospho-CoA kinase
MTNGRSLRAIQGTTFQSSVLPLKSNLHVALFVARWHTIVPTLLQTRRRSAAQHSPISKVGSFTFVHSSKEQSNQRMITTLFSRLVITFGDRSLPAKTIAEEVVMGILLVAPLGLLLGQISIRVAAHNPKWIRADIWNTVIRLIFADIVMEILLPSVQCLPLGEEPGYSLRILGQTWGIGCPKTSTGSLSPQATGVLFGIRIAFLCLGVFFGEGYFPICLTGGIACGKTTVGNILLYGKGTAETPDKMDEGSIYLVCTDKIAHDILLKDEPDSVYDQIVDDFGEEEVLNEDEEIDRKKLGAVIFADHSKRRLLNSITHPRIIYIMLKRIFYGIYLNYSDFCVADVPLLYESGKLRWLFGLVIVVACSKEEQLERLVKRNPELSREQCEDRIKSQMPIADKIKLGEIVVMNDGSLDELYDRVEDVRQELMNRVYGVGLSLLQLLLIMGASVPMAVASKLYTLKDGK